MCSCSCLGYMFIFMLYVYVYVMFVFVLYVHIDVMFMFVLCSCLCCVHVYVMFMFLLCSCFCWFMFALCSCLHYMFIFMLCVRVYVMFMFMLRLFQLVLLPRRFDWDNSARFYSPTITWSTVQISELITITRGKITPIPWNSIVRILGPTGRSARAIWLPAPDPDDLDLRLLARKEIHGS